MDAAKVQAVLDWLTPWPIRTLRDFLGLAGYYWKFVHGYDKIAAPLTALLKKNSFALTDQATEAFNQLKTALTTAPVLMLPDFGQAFTVECDALGAGCGAILHQGAGPVAYFSRALAPRHR